MSRARPPVRGLLAALAVALGVLGSGSPTHAQVLFDPDGAGGANGSRSILGLDWLPGSSVSLGIVPLNPITSPGTTFINLYQAKLGATTGTTSSIAGLNSTFEITVVLRLREQVDAVLGTTALFSSTADQTGSFLEIYYDVIGDAIGVTSDDLTGVGFTDGQLILTGVPLEGDFGDSSFNAQLGNIGLLDQAGGVDNRGGQMTISGSGAAVISTSVTFADPAFFITALSLIETEFNSSLVDPFRQVDPSITFFNDDALGREVTPTLGAINGFSGPDFQFQADANQSLIPLAVVPEPGTIVLALTGLATVSLGSLRKLRRRAGSPAA